MKDRYKDLLEAIEVERQHEENYYAKLSGQKTVKEKVEAGILLTHLQLDRAHFTVGENIELKFKRTKDENSPHKFRVGAGCHLIIEKDQTVSYKGSVSFKRKDLISIIIKGNDLNLRDFPTNILYKLQLVYDERPYRVMRTALEEVIKSDDPDVIELREGIRLQAPLHNDLKLEVQQNKNNILYLNDGQKEAISLVSIASKMGIVHGPPGTGKTTTLVALVERLLRSEKKILVCGPSNNSVDLLAKKMDAQGIRVLRIGNVTRIDDGTLHLTLDEKARNHHEWSNIKKVKIEAREARRQAGQFKRKFGHQERSNRSDMYKEARELNKWAKDLENRLIQSVISEAQVICTTLIGVSSSYIEDLRYETVLIDEASQALEPECWNAMLKAKRVILAGDHKQLPPTIKSSKAEELGLSITLLDRMTKSLKHKFMLSIQYRMNDLILGFSNVKFYGNKLSSDISARDRKLSKDSQVITLIDTSGCGFEEAINPKSRSLKNEGEYFIIREYLLSELNMLSDANIGIISPYAEQIKYIQQELSEESNFGNINITVNTIDGFQGQERDVIILSLVRSNEDGIIGFVADERRLNVALTRAKKRLVVIGDMATLGNHKLYIDLVEYFETKGEYKSAWEYIG